MEGAKRKTKKPQNSSILVPIKNPIEEEKKGQQEAQIDATPRTFKIKEDYQVVKEHLNSSNIEYTQTK